jgi:hypothetical protein
MLWGQGPHLSSIDLVSYINKQLCNLSNMAFKYVHVLCYILKTRSFYSGVWGEMSLYLHESAETFQ